VPEVQVDRDEINRIAEAEMPRVSLNIERGMYRHNVIDSLKGGQNVGIELGVAAGIFSSRMIESGKFTVFFGVDVYGDNHDTNQYKEALKRIGLLKPYKLLRMTFDEALDLFDDEFFDFIYVDGYAHTGEEGGQTLLSWYRKLKVGGIMAGDDYHADWPLVQWAVNDFVKQLNVALSVTEGSENVRYCKYPSWFFVKTEPDNGALRPNQRLLDIGRMERERIGEIRRRGSLNRFRRALDRILSAFGIKSL
jgi:hypothetical protein